MKEEALGGTPHADSRPPSLGAAMNKWLVAITVMLPTLIEIIDTSVVNVSLDHIRGSLSAGIDEATWTITSYLVSNAIVIPMTGWLSRLFGRKRYLIFSIGLFTFSSFMCGASWSLGSLVFFRILQGLGGGALQPISQAILLESFPRRQHGMAMAIFGIGIMFGPIIGPLMGGWITDNWSWHWIFFINVPIGILSIAMTLAVIVDPPYMQRMRMKVDYWGLTFLTLGLGCLQVVLDKGQREDWFASPFIIGLSVVSASALVLFLVVESFAEQPIIHLRVFRNGTFSSGNLIMFLTFFCLFGTIVLLPIYLQTLMGYTAYLAGLVLGPGGVVTMISMPIAGRLITKVHPKAVLITGLIIVAYSILLMSRFNLYADFASLAWPRVVLGVGMGFVFIPLTVLTMSSIPREETGNATAIYNLIRNLGGSFGVAFITTLQARRAQFHQTRLAENLTPFNLTLRQTVEGISTTLNPGAHSAAMDPHAAGLVYNQLLRQSSMLAFNDTFHLLFVFMLFLLPLALFMRRGHDLPTAPGMHG